MAWNPSPEVAVARDSAKRLGDASMCIVLWVTKDSRQLGMASYGKTMALCKDAGQLGDAAYQTIWERIEASA